LIPGDEKQEILDAATSLIAPAAELPDDSLLTSITPSPLNPLGIALVGVAPRVYYLPPAEAKTS
jgi:hypothetical protein